MQQGAVDLRCSCPGFVLWDVSARPFHCLAIDRNGQVWAWGNNLAGALGDGTTADRLLPVRVPRISSVVAPASGHHHTLAAQ